MSKQMFDRVETTEVVEDAGHSLSRPLNDWIVAEKATAAPAMFFGEFWLENEMAVLFAGAGLGKSVLAMQLAESIVRGQPISPLPMTASKRRVLYVDLEMNSRQLAMRYTADADSGRVMKKRYRFSNDLSLMPLDPEQLLAGKSPEQTAQMFGRLIETEITRHGARVLIVDSITALKRSYYGSNELLPVLRTLKRLVRNHDLSILVLADAPSTGRARSLTMSGLGGLRLVANAADSVIAIGASGHDPVGRYIKHLFSRSTPLVFNALHVPVCRIGKIGGNFLGFDFGGFGSERELLIDRHEQAETPMIEWIWEEAYKGRTIRQIALDCGRSKSTVHRLMQMRPIPPATETGDGQPIQEKSEEGEFPGCREYHDALHDPRFDILSECEHENDPGIDVLGEEAWLIELAWVRARDIYRKTGKTPRLCEDPALIEFYAKNSVTERIDSS